MFLFQVIGATCSPQMDAAMDACGDATRCQLCAKLPPARSKAQMPLPARLCGELPAALLPDADSRWNTLVGMEPQSTGRLCQKCHARVVGEARKADAWCRDAAVAQATRGHRGGVAAHRGGVAAHPKQQRLTEEASLRFEQRVLPLDATRALGLPYGEARPSLPAPWHRTSSMFDQLPGRPNDHGLRSACWHELDRSLAEGRQKPQPLVVLELLRGMGPDDPGPPLLMSSQLLPYNDEIGDGLDEARAALLKTSNSICMHEIEVEGHALDQLTCTGRTVHDRRWLCIDEEATRYRNPLLTKTGLYSRFGWADPDHAAHCCLFRHPGHVPLLVSQRHEPNPDLGAGADGVAPVLMYTPSVHKLLPRGHPGRTALEALLPPEGGTWLDCAPHLPADHTMAGWTLADILSALPESSKPYGHGHGFERLQTSGTQGDNVSQTWVPDNKRGSADHRVQRPLLAGQSIMEWDDASSALHYGVVCACIPAAEAAVAMLLPFDHPSRRARTRLAPNGRVWTYQAGKWYVTRRAAERFPGLVKRGHGSHDIDSYDAKTGKARTIEPHFDPGNGILWGGMDCREAAPAGREAAPAGREAAPNGTGYRCTQNGVAHDQGRSAHVHVQ